MGTQRARPPSIRYLGTIFSCSSQDLLVCVRRHDDDGVDSTMETNAALDISSPSITLDSGGIWPISSCVEDSSKQSVLLKLLPEHTNIK